jgi:hypothetical protein
MAGRKQGTIFRRCRKETMMPIAVDVSGAVEAQRTWRACRGLTPRVFPIQALIELLIDDIRSMRAEGRSDMQICQIILTATARHIRPEDIEAVCAHDEVGRALGGQTARRRGR